MASNFIPSSDLSSFYAGRMAPPIKLPDGTYIPAPNVMSVDEMYRGIYPPAMSSPPPLVSRSVNTVPIDANGNPIIPKPGFTADDMSKTRAQQSGARPAVTVGTQPAGTVTMPPGVRPASVGLPKPPVPPQQTLLAGMFGRGNGGYWSGALKDQAQLPPNDGGEAGFLQAFGPGATNPALTAIDQLTGSGQSSFPRPLPLAFAPRGGIDPATIPLPGPVIPLAGGPPVPRPAGAPPPIPGAITFKKGDTVSALAKRLGMTTSSFADRYGIANPNKIRAGQTVVPQAPVMPRMPPAGLNRAPPQVPMPRQRPNFQRTPASQGETFDSVWAEARG